MPSSVLLVLAVSGAIGFLTGAFLAPSWQDVLEPAQVLAGLVRYPDGNPVLLYSTNAWTLLHQLPALLLRAGFPERELSVFLSGVTGMVSFQALGVTTLAVGGDRALACVLPFFVHAVQAASGGVGYPVLLLGWPYTSGSIGLSLLLLAVSLLGARAYAAGLLLLGLLPAVHVTLGAWGLIVVVIAALASEAGMRRSLAASGGWLVAGFSIAAASALAHRVLFELPGDIAASDASNYIVAVVNFWDNHRRPFSRLSFAAAPSLICVVTVWIWLRWFRDDLPDDARFLFRALLAAAGLGLVFSLVLVIDPQLFGFWLWRAMPSRLMNLPLLACMAVVAGLAARQGGRSHLILAVMIVALAVVLAIDSRVVSFASSYLMLAAVVALVLEKRRRQGLPADARTFVGARAVALAVAIVLLSVGAWQGATMFAVRVNALGDRTSSDVFAAAAARPGVILTAADLHLVQLRTRRAVLLDGGALDALAYVPGAGPETARTLKQVYGIDLFAPGFPSREADGALPEDAGKELWHSRTVEEWQMLAADFNFTDVLTPEAWTLRLPIVASGEGLVLYAIPVR